MWCSHIDCRPIGNLRKPWVWQVHSERVTGLNGRAATRKLAKRAARHALMNQERQANLRRLEPGRAS